MQAKSEFLVTGNLKDWERWDRLHEIHTRELTIGAKRSPGLRNTLLAVMA
jgi:proline iminopeptidase